jgi:hypothetical protein
MQPRRIISIFLALALLCCCGGLTPLAQEGSEQQWLLVEVTNESGRPLRRACVTVVPRTGEIVFRNADSRGRVKLKKPQAGNYRVVVKVDGYEAQKREVIIGAKSETIAFTLQPRGNHR